jgi:bacterial/archaeal transporter family protein
MTWLIFALLSAITAALVTIFAKIGVQSLDSTLATTVRTIIMAILLVLISLSTKRLNQFSFASITGREYFFIFLSAIAGALSLLFYFAALKNGQAGKVATIDRMSLIFIALLSFLFLGEKLQPRGIVGIIFVVFGAILVSWK